MDRSDHTGSCQDALETLIEHRGDPSTAGPAVQRHLELCTDCRHAETEERALETLLERAAHAGSLGSDDHLEREIMRSLPRRGWRWRLLTALPVGTAALLAGAGALQLGGAPGIGVMGLVPAWSSRGWMAVLHGARDWAVAFDTVARNSDLLLPIAFSLAAALLAGAGLTGLTATTLRLRKSAIWSRHA